MVNIDFSKRSAVTGSQKNKERKYWLDKLAGDPVKTGFYKDFNKTGGKGGKEEIVTHRITGDFFSRLMALRNNSDHRLHMILVAGLAVLLSKHTGGSDIIVGTPIYKQEIEGDFINTVLALRNQVEPRMTFKELLMQVRQTVFEAAEHQNYPIEILLDQLDMSFSREEFPLFDTAVLLENIHDINYIRHIPFSVIFLFLRTSDALEVTVRFPGQFYEKSGMERIIGQFSRLLETAVYNVDLRLSELSISTEQEKQRLLYEFSGINRFTLINGDDNAKRNMLHEMFVEQADKTPDHLAIICRERQGPTQRHVSVTYRLLNEKANRLGNFLAGRLNIRPDERVGILMPPCTEYAAAMLAVLEAGGAYVPIEPSLPGERKKHIIDDAEIGVVISQAKYIADLNHLQWECPAFHSFICLDTHDVYTAEGVDNGEWFNDKKLWEYVGETAGDDIAGGGWVSSYTGNPLAKEEMDEYGDNALKKLTPLLHKNMRVLEIGCASGITMYRIAPRVGFYYGIDLSEVIIRKNRERMKKEGHQNIGLACLPAHEIDTVEEKDFDLVIINSVIQDFYGHNYLRSVISKAAALTGDNGYLFIGDIMDQALKENLVGELKEFKQARTAEGKHYRTKTDWSSELFVSREFFEDLRVEIPVIQDVEFSRKIHTIENELTKFRYDCLITLDKTNVQNRAGKELKKHKYQFDSRVLEEYGIDKPRTQVGPHNLAYIIYTSGTTGIPNGVMIEHRNICSTLRWFCGTYDLKTHSNLLQMTNISFDISLVEFFAPLTSGAALYIPGKEILLDKERLIPFLERHNIDVVQPVPSVLKAFLADVPKVGPVKVVICGGEALDEWLKNSIIAKGYRLYNHYGPTEAAVDAMAGQCDQSPVNIGKPIAGALAFVVDHTGHLQPVGVPGELLIGGAGLAREYLHNPVKTAEKFVPISKAIQSLPGEYLEKLQNHSHETRVYRSGDMVRWLDNGALEFIGRKDLQVKIRGFRIEPTEIETRLKNHECVKEAVVTTGVDEGGERYLCAYFTRADNDNRGDDDVMEIRDYLAALLPDYMVPAYFVPLDKLPLTSSGKVNRKKLPAVETVRTTGGRIAPGNEIEKKLAAIWSEILKIEQNTIGVTGNFFDLGGHSLKAAILVSHIHKELNVKVPLAEIFKTPTIRALAQYITGSAETKYVSLKAIEKKEYYNVSSAQERLYAMHQLGTDTSYNTPQAVTVEGELDPRGVEQTFYQLIKRHESLSTSFELKDEKPVQRIHDNLEFKVEVEVKEAARFIRPFDLSKAPLLRVGLIKIEESKHILIIDMHHIITDGISDDIFVGDFAALYRGEKLPPLRLQYKDFSEWEYTRNTSAEVKKQEAYWLEQFKDRIPVIDLPLDYPRPRVQTFEGELISFSIEEELCGKLNEFIKQEKDITLYMVLTAVFNILLSRYSGQDDIVVGFPITGRTHADLENIIGMFVNMLALRNRPLADKTFKEFVEEVKTNAHNAYSNQDFQYIELVEKLGIQRNPGKNPLFDCVFSFQEIDEGKTGDDHTNSSLGLKISPYEFESNAAKFDLQLRGTAGHGGIDMALEYKTALFKRETIEEMQKHFIEILEQVTTDAAIRLGDLVFSSHLVLGVPVGEAEEVDFNF